MNRYLTPREWQIYRKTPCWRKNSLNGHSRHFYVTSERKIESKLHRKQQIAKRALIELNFLFKIIVYTSYQYQASKKFLLAYKKCSRKGIPLLPHFLIPHRFPGKCKSLSESGTQMYRIICHNVIIILISKTICIELKVTRISTILLYLLKSIGSGDKSLPNPHRNLPFQDCNLHLFTLSISLFEIICYFTIYCYCIDWFVCQKLSFVLLVAFT